MELGTHVSATSQMPLLPRHVTDGANSVLSAVQVPLVVPPRVVLQAMQSFHEPPPQEVLQQTLSTQCPDAHWPPFEQGSPFVRQVSCECAQPSGVPLERLR